MVWCAVLGDVSECCTYRATPTVHHVCNAACPFHIGGTVPTSCSKPRPLAARLHFVVYQDRNAGRCCAAMGALPPVVLLSVQTSVGDWSAQPNLCGPLCLQGGQQQRHRPQPVPVGGVNDITLNNPYSRRKQHSVT